MPNSGRRLTPEQSEDDPRNPNHPENDGAVAGPGAGRHRDENSLSFRHFLQPHSDVVPQPAPTRPRNSRGPHTGAVDLVDVTMALPDFVQDHLIMESLAASGDNPNDPSSSRSLQHGGPPLDLNVLNEILPDFGSSQRNPIRVTQGSNRRRNGSDQPALNGESPMQHSSSALPDFLSDGPMQLNHNDASIINSPSSSCASRAGRNRISLENHLPDEPVRGPSFESKESLRLEIDRLRRELTEKNRRLMQIETELTRCRSTTGSFETALRVAEKNVSDANKRASEAERHVSILSKELDRLKLGNGHVEKDSAGAGTSSSPVVPNGVESQSLDPRLVLNMARSSEILISQLAHQIEELKRVATLGAKGDAQSHGEKSKGKDSSKKPH